MNRTPRPRTAAIFAALLVAILLAACAASGANPALGPAGDGLTGVGTGRDNTGGLPVAEPPIGLDGKGGTGQGGSDPLAGLADRSIVKTGEITLEVPNVGTAIGKVRALALQLGGYVGSSQIGNPQPYPYPVQPGGIVQDPAAGVSDKMPIFTGTASLTLRLPADRFDEAITRLHAFDGTVITEATQEQDVTSQLVDIEARLKNLQASEVQYRALLEKATKIEDILAVQARLDDVRGQIEQWQAQQKQLADVADLATLTVTLSSTAIQQATDTWDPGKTISDAFAALVTFGQNVANGLIWFVIVWLPALIVIAILALVAWRFVPRMRRPMLTAAVSAEVAEAPVATEPKKKA